MSTRDDTHRFANGLTRADAHDVVDTVFRKRAERARRSRDNCEYVREQMRVREPRIHAAYEKAVRDA